VSPDADTAFLPALARTMKSYFTSFIKNGEPRDGRVEWPADAATAADRQGMTFAPPLPPYGWGLKARHAMVKDDSVREAERCDFWQAAPYDLQIAKKREMD
jgi:hypothetical protein